MAGPASVTDAASSGRARAPIFAHRASKVSGSVGAVFGAHAWESSGLRGLAGAVLASSSAEVVCADTSLGHYNNDLVSPGLSSYLQFRQSIRLTDQQRPCIF